MCNKFITLLSLVSLVSFQGLTADNKLSAKKVASTSVGDSSPACCGLTTTVTNASYLSSADGTIKASLSCSSAFNGNTALFYLTNSTSTITQLSPAIALGTTSVTFSGLSAENYTVSAVILSPSGCVCITNCAAATVSSNSTTPCAVTIIPNGDGTVGSDGYVNIAAVPGQILGAPVGTLFEFDYSWNLSNSTLTGNGSTISAGRPGTYTVTAQGPKLLECSSACCTSAMYNVVQGTTDNPGTCLNSSSQNVTLTVTATQPSTPFSCDGSIQVSSTDLTGFATIYSVTDLNSTESILTLDGGSPVTFSNLYSATYYVTAVAAPSGNYTCVSDGFATSLTGQGTFNVSICQQNSVCGNYVTLVAVPNAGNSTIPACTNLTYVWEFLADGATVPCIIGTGPSIQATSSGTYTVTATVPNNDCNDVICATTSAPVVLTDLTPKFDICGKANVCLGQAINLCVVFPAGDTDTYSFVWTVNGVDQQNDQAQFTYQPTLTEPGTVEICVTVTDQTTGGCSTTCCILATVNAAPQITMADECVCTGGSLIFEVCATQDTVNCCLPIIKSPASATLIVTGPACFSFESPISLNGPCVTVKVSDFAGFENGGCYYATVVDQNGCIGTNIGAPARAIVIPCCPASPE